MDKYLSKIPTDLVMTSVTNDWGGWRSYKERDGEIDVYVDSDANLPSCPYCYYVKDECLLPTMLDHIPEMAHLGFTVLKNDYFIDDWLIVGTDKYRYEDNMAMFESLYDMLGFDWHSKD